jgi:glycosyltransferase
MMREVEDEVEADVMKEGTYQVGFEFGVREEGAAVGKSTHWELPAKKVESTPIADYVISQGAGERIDHRAQSVDEMREKIYKVATSESYRVGASRLYQQWLATPSPAEIVPTLENMTDEHKSRGSVIDLE